MNKKSLNLTLVLAMIALGVWYWNASFLTTILVISFLIFFHELGHFLVAVWLGVKVNVFSIGFGDKIYTKTYRGTQYCISAIPLGGYVSMKGQDDLDPNVVNNDSDSYTAQTPFRRILILFAGPVFNLILAFLIYIALGYIGVDKLAPKVGKVLENSAAMNAGVLKGDEIVEIDGKNVREWDQISKLVSLKELNLAINRDGQKINLTLTPKIDEKQNIWGETIKIPMIGISPEYEFVRLYHKGFDSFKFAIDETYKASTMIVAGLEKLVTGVVPAKEMGGIVAIVDITSKAAQTSLSVLLLLMALISVNLGILNLLPIPVLDGGHIVFNIYEMIFKKQIPQKVFSGLIYAGMALLFALMAFTIVNDFLRLGGVYSNG